MAYETLITSYLTRSVGRVAGSCRTSTRTVPYVHFSQRFIWEFIQDVKTDRNEGVLELRLPLLETARGNHYNAESSGSGDGSDDGDHAH